MSGPPAAVVQAAQNTPKVEASEITIGKLRERLAWFRDKRKEKADAEERLKGLNVEIYQAERKELPDLFDGAQVPFLGLEADGNLPAIRADVSNYYKANIAAEWEPERRAAAFKWLDDNGHGDMIRTDVTVSFAREDRALALLFAGMVKNVDPTLIMRAAMGAIQSAGGDVRAFEKVLENYEGRDPPRPSVTSKENVPWNTLTSWLKEQVEKGTTPPLDTIGGEVGRIVKIKEL